MEASVCRNCQVFFGCQEGLCSKCFKESKLANRIASTKDLLSVPDGNPRPVEEIKEPVPVQVSDKCSFCSKKLGPLSVKCKCSQYFCVRHRLPEEHNCTFDHKASGIRKLSEENPLVQAPKFNKLQ
jgi:AN1-like Zinc finger